MFYNRGRGTVPTEGKHAWNRDVVLSRCHDMTQIFSDTDRTLHEVHRQVGRRYGTRFRKEVSVGAWTT